MLRWKTLCNFGCVGKAMTKSFASRSYNVESSTRAWYFLQENLFIFKYKLKVSSPSKWMAWGFIFPTKKVPWWPKSWNWKVACLLWPCGSLWSFSKCCNSSWNAPGVYLVWGRVGRVASHLWHWEVFHGGGCVTRVICTIYLRTTIGSDHQGLKGTRKEANLVQKNPFL